MSIIDDMEAKPECPFHPISSMEVEEGLKNTSNFSAPGPDHVSWFWLKRIIAVVEEIDQEDESGKRKKRDDTVLPMSKIGRAHV